MFMFTFLYGALYILTGLFLMSSSLLPVNYYDAIEDIMDVHPLATLIGLLLWPLVMLVALFVAIRRS